MVRIISSILLLSFLLGCRSPLGAPSTLKYVLSVGTNLDGTLEVNQTHAKSGEPVQITFTLKNEGFVQTGKPEILQTRTKSVMDIVIGYSTEEFARWSKQQPPDKVLHRLELAPGHSETIQMTWVPDERAQGHPVLIQGVVNRSEDENRVGGVLLPVGFEFGY